MNKRSRFIIAVGALISAFFSLCFALDVTVTTYGAKGDGVNDDRTAIQAAIDAVGAAGGGIVNFPAGIYRITAVKRQAWVNEIVLRPKVTLKGVGKDKSIIKMADNQGCWGSVFGGSANNFSMIDMGMNFNSATNPCIPQGTIGDQCAHIGIQTSGANFNFKRCHFFNHSGVWIIVGSAANLTVDSCIFDSIGGPYEHDHSTIYTDCNGPVMISNNIFSTKYGPGTKGAFTAIELHGSNQKFINNKIYGFRYGINVVAGGSIRPVRNQQYIGNTISGVGAGFVFWNPVDSLLFQDNDVTIDTKGWNALYPGEPHSAFQLNQGVSAGPVNNMRILNNRITYKDIARNVYMDAGMFLSGSWYNFTAVFKNLIISGNKITSPVSAGMLINATIQTGEISNDTIINPGYSVGSAEYKSGIYLTGSFSNVHVNSNLIIDNQTTHKTLYGIYENTNNTGGCTQCKNAVNITDKASIPVFFQAGGHVGAAYGTTCVSTTLPLPQIKIFNNLPEIQIVKTSELLRAYLSSEGIKTVTITDIQGKKLVKGLVEGQGWFETPKNMLVPGLNIITVKNEEGKVSRRILNF